jgi:hypothetical protein
MGMKVYSFYVDYLVTDYAPMLLRKIRLFSFIACMLAPVDVLFNMFSTLVYRLRFYGKYTGQVAYLTKVLNEVYYGIRIEDGIYESPVYLHNKIEGFETVYLQNKTETPYAPLWIENKGEYYVSKYDFKVLVPSVIYDSMNGENDLKRIEAIVTQYTLINKRFIIERYEF